MTDPVDPHDLNYTNDWELSEDEGRSLKAKPNADPTMLWATSVSFVGSLLFILQRHLAKLEGRG